MPRWEFPGPFLRSRAQPPKGFSKKSLAPSLIAWTASLTVACPLTSETRGKFNAALLARLPRGARFINISRGEVVDEPALIAALENGHLGGAYLDVFMQEPLPAASPLWNLPNVIVTPHNSVASAGNEMRINALFLDNLKRWHESRPLINEVKKS